MEGISVIIPTTGKRQTLVDAISSVYRQEDIENFSVEIIVVNDGNCLDADLSEFEGKKNFRVVNTGGFMGANFARNIGVELTNSEWISFLDDDDIWHYTKLKYQLRYRDENTLSFCKKKFFVNNTQRIERVSKVHSSNLYLFNYVGSTSSIFLSRKIFNKVGGFRNDLPALQDWDLYLRLQNVGVRFDFIKETHIKYRLSPNGRISTNINRQFRAAFLLATKDCPSPIFLFGLLLHLTRAICNRYLLRS